MPAVQTIHVTAIGNERRVSAFTRQGSSMIVEYIRYQNDASEVTAFLSAYETAAHSLRESVHCLSYELTRCSDEPGTFVLRIVWDSADGHMKGFRVSPEFKPFLAAIQPYIKNIQEMRHYELTDVTWARS